MDEQENLNEQFQELIDLIDKEHDYKFSMESFERKKISKKKWFIRFSFLLFFFICLSIILSNDEWSYNLYFILLSFIRLILVQIHPYWDWTTIYTNPCFISNPFFNHSFDISDCQKCVNTSTIVQQSNMTFFNFTKNIYFNHRPVIVDDATDNWSAMKKLTVKKLFQLFVEDSILAEHDLCYFEANIRQYNQPGGADQLFNDYLDDKRRSFIAHWNNCKRETLKILRSYYHKPYFLPPSVGQTLMGNWFLVSVGFEKDTKRMHQIPLNYNWIWLAQIQGSSSIELQPKYPCEAICPTMKSIKLKHGDLIMYSRLYNARYSPLNRETVLLAQGVD